MNSVYNCVDSVAKNANRFNLDDLLMVTVEDNTPEAICKDLQTIYFHATEALFKEDGEMDLTNQLRNAFITMRQLIEALSTANDIKAAKLAVTIK